MAETDQIAEETKTKEPMSAEQATEFSILFAMLAGSGVVGDTEKYRDTVVATFTKILDGFGYKIVPK